MADRLSPRTQIGWQVFRRTGARPHDTVAGWNISLVRYESHCATCGAFFEGLASRGAWRKRELTRRCPRHRPGGVVDNMAPPVPLRDLPAWARPNTDPKKLKASLGRRQHNCALLGTSKRLRIIEPKERDRIVAERAAEAEAKFAARLAAWRASARPPAQRPPVGPAEALQRPAAAVPELSFLD